MLRKIYNTIITIMAAIKTLPTLYKVKKMEYNELSDAKTKLIKKTTQGFGDTVMKVNKAELIVEGIENCSNIKTALFVSNHQSNFDIPLLLKVVPQQIGFISKIELKKLPIFGTWITEMNGIYIDRENKRQSLQAIKDGIIKLKEGHSLVIFPEGTRSKGLKINEFKTGSLTLAARADVPIIPVAIEGTYNVGVDKKPIITITFLNPIYLQPNDKLNDVTYSIQKNIEHVVEDNKQYIKELKQNKIC